MWGAETVPEDFEVRQEEARLRVGIKFHGGVGRPLRASKSLPQDVRRAGGGGGRNRLPDGGLELLDGHGGPQVRQEPLQHRLTKTPPDAAPFRGRRKAR